MILHDRLNQQQDVIMTTFVAGGTSSVGRVLLQVIEKTSFLHYDKVSSTGINS